MSVEVEVTIKLQRISSNQKSGLHQAFMNLIQTLAFAIQVRVKFNLSLHLQAQSVEGQKRRTKAGRVRGFQEEIGSVPSMRGEVRQ